MPSSEASPGLSDVDPSTRAWHLVHDVRLFLDGERVFDFSKHGPESRARSKILHAFLILACYIASST